MKLLPASLQGRLIALLLLALVLAQAVSFAIFAFERNRVVESLLLDYLQSRISEVIDSVESAPPGQRPRLGDAGKRSRLRFRLARENRLADGGGVESPRLAATLRDGLNQNVQALHVYVSNDRSGSDNRSRPPYLGVAVKLAPERWLLVVKPVRGAPPFWTRDALISLLLSAALIILVVVFASRHITRGLARLSAASERIGRGEVVEALPETGPSDIRRTTRAFNQMQTRLHRYLRDRMQMLAAISHDLRTPITALRLRAEYIEDADNRTRVLALLEEMQAMTEATLAFTREEAAEEAARRTDLVALVDSVCEDYIEMGRPVHMQPASPLATTCRPLSLRRAVRNLIDNALAYAGTAEVALGTTAGMVSIIVRDTGPGIAEQDMQRVFEPFTRVDASRSRETGGIGLGLAITRTIARAHGGEVRLENRAAGGLEAHLEFPLRR